MSIDPTELAEAAPRLAHPASLHALGEAAAEPPLQTALELLAPHLNLIVTVIAATFYPDYRPELEIWLATLTRRYPVALLATIQRILNGERDADALCSMLDQASAAVVRCIVCSIENPSALKPYLASHPEYASRFRLRKKYRT